MKNSEKLLVFWERSRIKKEIKELVFNMNFPRDDSVDALAFAMNSHGYKL